MFEFRVTHRDGTARRGLLVTPHGVVDTPAFMPVGTAGAVKGVTPAQLRATGTRIILANTYHLQLRPTADVVRDLGGLHRFMGWNGPILTDSGGYQVYSLARINRIDDDGVDFQSHIDGAAMRLDPASAMAIQNKLGADIIMAFDDCPPLSASHGYAETDDGASANAEEVDDVDGAGGGILAPPASVRRGRTLRGSVVRDTASPERIEQAVERTIRWATASKGAHARKDQALFGIVQGGLDLGLRERCAAALIKIGFEGYAIGGLSVGETHEQMAGVLGPVAAMLPDDRPRYLMGVGTPRDIVLAVRAGIDLFDCVLPTRNGRNSHAFTAGGTLKMRNEQYRLDDRPLEPGCDCEACKVFSRGYIRHMFLAGEMLGPILTSIHNLRFYQRLMARVRERVEAGNLVGIEQEFPITGQDAAP